MTDRCSACGRAVESRTRGAARILAALQTLEDLEPPPFREQSVGVLVMAKDTIVRELRDIANEMLCLCEQSSAMAEVA